MRDLATLSRSDFEPLIGASFILISQAPPVTAELIAATRTSARATPEGREPFSIQFKAPPGTQLWQGIYRVENDRFGTAEIFLVPYQANAAGFFLEGVFS